MKIISWNVNGLRACMKKGFLKSFRNMQPDVMCIQETKMQEGQADVPLPDYHQYWYGAEKKGYSGTLVLARREPLSVSLGIGTDIHDHEGRVITAEYEDLYLVNVYTPNSQQELKRLEYRMAWDDAFRAYVASLDEKKPVVICGDMNVAHKPIDLKNPSSNVRNAGFTEEERSKMTLLQDAGFTDTFRYFYPDREGAYSWWSYRFDARSRNAGWRIDYFLASRRLEKRLRSSEILADFYGSDHCPVMLEISDPDAV